MVRIRLACLAAALSLVSLAGCGGDEQPSPVPPASGVLQTAPVYASRDKVLHLRVRAHTTTSSIAGQRYKRMDIYDTSLVDGKGTFTPGTASGYIGAQWNVQPGDTVIVDYINDLEDTSFQPVGAAKPEMIPQPLNLHTHGLTVSPAGNSDNILLSIPQKRSNHFEIKIPKTQYRGLYWYHPHIHGITDEQVYNGLAGHIVVGRADGDYKELDGLRTHPLMIRYNVRPPGDEESNKGELIDASPFDTTGTALAMPKDKPRGKMIYTVNGQLRPTIEMRAARGSTPAESQVWAMTNVTGSASYIVALDEVDAAHAQDVGEKGRPLDFTIVSIDGTPMSRPKVISGEEAARGYLLGQGGRVAILVQGPSDPSKVVRLLQVENRSGTGDASAWMNGTKIGGWRDYTRDVLAIGEDVPGRSGRHVDTPAKLTTNYEAENKHLERADVDHKRRFVFDGVAKPTREEPNQFPINAGLFPYNRVDQPRAGTVEEWTILNDSSLHHPFHVHTQYAKVMEIVAPDAPAGVDPPGAYRTLQRVTELNQPDPAPWTQDVVNLPPAKVDAKTGMPILDARGHAVAPGKVVLRLSFEDYLGEYVEHCHRLPHEDRGMMSLVRTIPKDSVVATTVDAFGQILVRSEVDHEVLASLRPFEGATTSMSTALGDVDGDAIADLAVGSGTGRTTTMRVFSGASRYKNAIFDFEPFGDKSRTGASVALSDLNGDGRDELIAGQGAGGSPRVAIFDGIDGGRLADFDAYDESFRGGVSVAAGMLEEGGRMSLVTGAGRGGPPTVNVYNFDLFGDADGSFPDVHAHLEPLKVKSFAGADPGDRDGVSVATGNPFAASGGFSDVLVASSSALRVFRVAQHSEHAGHDFAPSGVMRPHDYQPGAPRMVTEVDKVGLDIVSEAVVSSVSTPEHALVLVAGRGGGRIHRFAPDSRGRLQPVVTRQIGFGVAGI